MNWWQAVLHDLPRQRHRARADGPQRPRRHEVRHSLPRLLPGVASASSAPTCRRCCGRWSPAAGSASRRGSAARRSTRSSTVFFPSWDDAADICRCSASTPPQLGCFLFFWADQHAGHLQGHRVDPHPAEHQGAAADRARPRPAWPGRTSRPAASAPMLSQPSQFAAGRAEGRAVLGVLLPRADGQRRLLGHAVAQHPRLQPLRPLAARPGRSARRSACRRRWRLFSFIGVAVTSADRSSSTAQAAIWDPVVAAHASSRTRSCWSWRWSSLCLATLATNIAANVVSPANDFAHLWPRTISFRIGGLITGVIGILIQPWRLLANASVYIDKWLIGYSLLLGAV